MALESSEEKDSKDLAVREEILMTRAGITLAASKFRGGLLKKPQAGLGSKSFWTEALMWPATGAETPCNWFLRYLHHSVGIAGMRWMDRAVAHRSLCPCPGGSIHCLQCPMWLFFLFLFGDVLDLGHSPRGWVDRPKLCFWGGGSIFRGFYRLYPSDTDTRTHGRNN